MNNAPTVRREHYGLIETVLNQCAGVLKALRLPVADLTAPSIRTSAERTTGLTDWGNPLHKEAFERLVDMVSGDEFTALSNIVTRQAMIKAAANRLQMVDYLKSHQQEMTKPFGRPVFVLGFPRTGTTLLQNLLCLDPGRRALPFWELTNPIPIHKDPGTDRHARIQSAENVLSLAYRFAPEMRTIHEITAETAEECWYLFFHCFAVLNYDLQTGTNTFGDWLLTQDMQWAYEGYRSQLSILNHNWPARNLVLKCPEHLWFMDALLEVFPDACVIWTHRDPVASIASYCSLISLTYRMHFGNMQPHRIGAHIRKRFHQGVTRAMASREAYGNEDTFFDVRFHELVQDPGAMVDQITDHFDLPKVADEAIQNWLNNGRSDKRGAHQYSAERYGLDRCAILKEFAPYIERFGIHVKSP